MEIREQDVGVELLVTLKDEDGVAVDVSGATAIKFRFRKPDGTEISRSGSVKTTGSDGKVQYVTASGDLDQLGSWRYQVRTEYEDGAVLTSEMSKFKVTDAILV